MLKINSQMKERPERIYLLQTSLGTAKPENDGFAESLVRKITGENSTGKVSYGTEAGQFQEDGYSTVIHVVLVQLNKLTKQMNT